jgi:tRNA(Glu) U13 pseudouridine synthase TruD
MQNIRKGFAHFSPGKKGRRDTFMVSVVQSALFNIWLKKRMETGDYRRLLAGDIVKKTDTGGMFIVDDPVIETPRFDAGEIVYTGPIYGFKMKAAIHAAGEREATCFSIDSVSPRKISGGCDHRDRDGKPSCVSRI